MFYSISFWNSILTKRNQKIKKTIRRELTAERRMFLSTDLANRREIRFGMAAAFVSVLIFFSILPFATRPLARIPAFIPAYESVLVIGDLITGAMLFSQFNILRSRALFVLAGGYLFTALIAVAHALSFPGVFSPTGLLGAGPQTTGWLYMFWHGGFPLFIILYAYLKGESCEAAGIGEVSGVPPGGIGIATLVGIAAILAAVCGLTLVATAYQDYLPVLIVNDHFSVTMTGVVSSCWALSFFALIFLWRRRPHTVLDLWLMVVMSAWLCDIALSAVVNAGRFDAGWYAGRIYGLLAASSLLIVLLIESGTQYANLLQLSVKLRAANNALQKLSKEDALTSIANRRSFDTYLAGQITIARRHKRALALVLCDVDSFKAFNDNYGHQAGDECLKNIAAALRSCCRRPADMAARYGGEEFAMILPETETIGATEIAEAAREAVIRLRVLHEHSPAGPYVSISGGIAVLRGNTEMTAIQLIAAADESLYEAKHLGRNRMIASQMERERNMLSFDERKGIELSLQDGRPA